MDKGLMRNLKSLLTERYPEDSEYIDHIHDGMSVGLTMKRFLNGEDIDDLLGYNDSVIREYVFKLFAELTGTSYDYFYQVWLWYGKIQQMLNA